MKSVLLSVSMFLDHVKTFHPTRSNLKGFEVSALLYHLGRLPHGRNVAFQLKKMKQQTTSECLIQVWELYNSHDIEGCLGIKKSALK